MKRIFKIFISSVAVLLLTVQMNLFTSCNDDLAAESYYTFTGEMMSDYLKNREDFSLFRRIVERANRMDFMASRGSRTFFPAVNSGVEAFLQERGYSSVDDIPVEKIHKFAEDFSEHLSIQKKALLDKISKEKQLDDKLIEEIKSVSKLFRETWKA